MVLANKQIRLLEIAFVFIDKTQSQWILARFMDC